MPMPRRRLALPLGLVLLAGAALAGPQPGSEPIDRLIERSGLAAQITNYQAAMQAGIDSAHAMRHEIGSANVEQLRRAVAYAYSASSLRPVLRSELAKRLTQKEIAAALAWLDSPVGRKLTALEEAASTPEAQQRIARVVRAGALDVAPGRAQTLHALIRATHAAEVGASLMIQSAIGIWEASGNSTPDFTAALRRELEARRSEIVAEMHQRSFGAFSVVYASASDAELAALLAFARSPAGAKYHSASASAFQSTLVQAARKLGGTLAVPAAPAGN